MNDRDRPKPKRDWDLIVVALLAAFLLVAGITYKYTGDFTGLLKLGTSGVGSKN